MGLRKKGDPEVMLYAELEAVVMPDGLIQLEWIESSRKLSNATDVLQHAIFDQYAANPGNWLLFLGFCQKNIPLSPSLGFWRSFANLFTQKLRLTPDLEQQRGRVVMPLDPDELKDLANRIPPMTGGEYLKADLLRWWWQRLHDSFSQQIATFTGTVAAFIKGYSPDIHVVGRIYFHLVENRQGPDPFAFLATYATALNADGQSREKGTDLFLTYIAIFVNSFLCLDKPVSSFPIVHTM